MTTYSYVENFERLAIITPMPLASTCGRVRPPALLQQLKLDVQVESKNPVSTRLPLRKSKKEKITESTAK